MSDSLEQLAAKGAKDQASRDAAQQASRAAEQRAQQALDDRVVRRSLATSKGGMGLWLLGIAPVVALGMAIPAVLEGVAAAVALIVLGVTFAAVLFAAIKLTERRAVGRAMHWLSHLPFPFDIDAYLAGLANTGMQRRIALRVVFAEIPSEADRALFADAVAGAAAMERPKWKGAALTVASETLQTYVPSSGDRDSYYTNGPMHLWVVAVIDTAVRSMQARQLIERVEVQFP
ncbi:MAG: hypothetical protein KC912_24350 [Proteobacteria bacterium]|nr:hypothetical protein [Pseudomonadota bacterium]